MFLSVFPTCSDFVFRIDLKVKTFLKESDYHKRSIKIMHVNKGHTLGIIGDLPKILLVISSQKLNDNIMFTEKILKGSCFWKKERAIFPLYSKYVPRKTR